MNCILPFFLAFTSGLSAFSVTSSSQIAFYKSSSSRFPSGYAPIETLVKHQLKTAETSMSGYMVKSEFYALDELQPVNALHLSHFVIHRKTDQKLKVLQVMTHGLQVQNLTTQKKDFFKFNELRTDHFDLGTVVTLNDVFLRASADKKSSVQTTIPRGFRLTPLQFTNQFVQVKYKDYLGYIELKELLTKFDLATMALIKGEWVMIDKREGGQIISHLKKMIDLKEVTALITPETKGIIASKDQKVPYLTLVEQVTLNESIWKQSHIKGHGLVWWKKPFFDKTNSKVDEIILVDQLLLKPISHVSFQSKNPLKGVLSSNGVYITADGLHWRKIPQFNDFNGPVHYFSDNLIFVGHFRSLDGGRSFENYIQIDKLSAAIESKYGILPRQLMVEKIETRPPYKLKIKVDSGFKKIELESPLFTQNWKAL